MSEIEDLQARIAHLKAQGKREDTLAAAAAKAAEDPTAANLAAHNTAAEALVAHRAKVRGTGGPRVGGDAVTVTPDQAEGGEQ